MVVSGCLVIQRQEKYMVQTGMEDSNLFIIWNCSGAYYMVPHYTDGIRSVDWFVCYNDGHIGRSVYYPEYQDS